MPQDVSSFSDASTLALRFWHAVCTYLEFRSSIVLKRLHEAGPRMGPWKAVTDKEEENGSAQVPQRI